MERFNKKFTTDTKVKIAGIEGWFKVKEVHESRQWIKVDGLGGSFQRNHVERFTNKGGQAQ